MNSTHSTRHVLSVVAFAAFALSALPAAAADKEYALHISAPSATGTQIVTAVFRNTSPAGGASSNIKFLRLVTPDSNTTFAPDDSPTSPTIVSTSPATSCVRQNDREVWCSNLQTPIVKNAEFTLRVRVNLGAGSCNGVWNPDPPIPGAFIDDVNTGSQYGVGQWFTKVPYTSPLGVVYDSTLAAGASASVSITGPTSLLFDQPAPITATVKDACGSTVSSTTISYVATNAAPSPGSGTTDTSGSFSFNITPGTGSTVKVDVTALSVTNSKTFTVFDAGNLACTSSLSGVVANPGSLPDTAPGSAGGSRGAVDAYLGTCGPAVNYSVDNNILTNNTFGFQWDLGVQRDAAFLLFANLKAQSVDTSTGWVAAQPKLKTGWKYDTSANPIYINGIACLAPHVAKNYGTVSDVGSGTVTVTTTTTPPPTPFIVAINGKRARVTNVAGNLWTITPAMASTDIGAFVVSKYPLLPEVYANVVSVASSTVITYDNTNGRDFPPVPFPITIAKPATISTPTTWERIWVTAHDTTAKTLTVTRGHGLTTSLSDGDLVGQKIVSNPLPLIPSGAIPTGVTAYTVGSQAQMCIVSDTLSSIGLNSSGVAQVMRTVEWLDIGDGWIGTEDQ